MVLIMGARLHLCTHPLYPAYKRTHHDLNCLIMLSCSYDAVIPENYVVYIVCKTSSQRYVCMPMLCNQCYSLFAYCRVTYFQE